MRIEHPTDKTNFTIVHTDNYSVAFSYKTAIGFRDNFPSQDESHGWVVRKNDWGPTTGKHLNWLRLNKTDRIPGSEFEELLNKLVSTDAVDTEAGA